MKTFKEKLYPHYLERLRKIDEEFKSGKSRDYCRENALIEYYIIFGALNYMLLSGKIKCERFSLLSQEACKEYEECVNKLKRAV